MFDTVGVPDALAFYGGVPSAAMFLSFPPNEEEDFILDAFAVLRGKTYTPERGVFYVATVTASRDGGLAVRYDYGSDPHFDFPIAGWSYEADPKVLPRNPATGLLLGWVTSDLRLRVHSFGAEPFWAQRTSHG